MIYRLEFEYEGDYGDIYPVKAQVEIKGDEAEVLEVDACGRDGGELSDHLMACIDEMALELAWRMNDKQRGEPQ